ncbi:hypothetical protein [Planctomycetes bacterium K23_9]
MHYDRDGKINDRKYQDAETVELSKMNRMNPYDPPNLQPVDDDASRDRRAAEADDMPKWLLVGLVILVLAGIAASLF